LIITKVLTDKKKMKVIFDDQNYLLLDYDLIAKYSLYSKKEISKELFLELKEEEEVIKLYNYSLSYLSKYSKTEEAFYSYLINKGYTDEIVRTVIKKLISNNYLDDFSFTDRKIYSLISRGYGKFYINSKLKSLGVSDTIINDYDYTLVEEFYTENFLKIANKQKRLYSKFSIFEQRKKLNSYLTRRGYEFSLINNFINKI